MDIKEIPIPEVYKESQDFRFFLEWFSKSLDKINYDTQNFIDLYDPLRCPEDLLWALADTMGYKYDNRLPASFNRLVLVYFMSMIRNKGSKDGVTLAAETNLAQFNILMQAQGYEDEDGNEVEGKDILNNRLEDLSIPVNSVYVTPHTDKGYIDVVYFSTKKPIDACIEYVRPLGMYLFQYAGVRYDARTKISIDSRLTNTNDIGVSIGATHVGHYSRDDYARMQKTTSPTENDTNDTRRNVWYRNSKSEGVISEDPLTPPDNDINPGYRALYSLQLCNNENIVKSLIDPIFSLGYGPQDVTTTYVDDYLKYPYQDHYSNGVSISGKAWNLRYDRGTDEANTANDGNGNYDVETVDADRTENVMKPRPAVNPNMMQVGDAISLNDQNTKYTKVNENGDIESVNSDEV